MISPAASRPMIHYCAAAGRLTPAALDAVAPLRTAVAAYTALTGDSTTANALAAQPLTAALSQSWPDDAAAVPYATAATQWLNGLMTQVKLSATPDVSLTSRKAAFPVTIANGLKSAVHVRIVTTVTPLTGSRAMVTIPTATADIQPGDKVTVTLSPTVLREGDVSAELQLTTPDGTPIGPPVVVRVRAQSSAWMGWAVIGTAFVLFGVGTFLRVRSAKRKPASTPGAAGPSEPPEPSPWLASQGDGQGDGSAGSPHPEGGDADE